MLKHFWIFFIFATWYNLRASKSSIEKRIENQPDLKEGYDNLYKGYLFWCNLPWILMGFLILSGKVNSIADFLLPGKSNEYVTFWFLAMVILLAYFLYWIFLKEGAEILAKYPGLPMVPQLSAHKIRYFAVGLVVWNLIFIGFFLYIKGSLFPVIPEQVLPELPDWFWKKLFPVYFIALWVVVGYLISIMGGWSTLAKHYSVKSPFTGEYFRLRSGQLGSLANYGGCLTLGANSGGLYLAVLFIFRTGHPPLFIPWEDITPQHKKKWLFSLVELQFSKSPGNSLSISKGLAEKLANASGGRLHL